MGERSRIGAVETVMRMELRVGVLILMVVPMVIVVGVFLFVFVFVIVLLDQGGFDLRLVEPALGVVGENEQGGAGLQARLGVRDRGLLGRRFRRVLESDDIGRGRDQLDFQRPPLDREVEMGDAVFMGTVAFLGVSVSGHGGHRQSKGQEGSTHDGTQSE